MIISVAKLMCDVSERSKALAFVQVHFKVPKDEKCWVFILPYFQFNLPSYCTKLLSID